MAVINADSGSSSKITLSMQGSPSLVAAGVRTWVAVFVLASLALFICEPSALVTGNIAVALMFAMAMIVQSSVTKFDDAKAFETKQQLVALLAPAHFACLIWLAVHAGRMVFSSSLITSSLASLMALAMIVLLDAALTAAVLLASERGQGVSGLSLAALISSKYAGLLGKIA